MVRFSSDRMKLKQLGLYEEIPGEECHLLECAIPGVDADGVHIVTLPKNSLLYGDEQWFSYKEEGIKQYEDSCKKYKANRDLKLVDLSSNTLKTLEPILSNPGLTKADRENFYRVGPLTVKDESGKDVKLYDFPDFFSAEDEAKGIQGNAQIANMFWAVGYDGWFIPYRSVYEKYLGKNRFFHPTVQLGKPEDVLTLISDSCYDEFD